MVLEKKLLHLLLCILYSLLPYICFLIGIRLQYIVRGEQIYIFSITLSLLLGFILVHFEKKNIISCIKYHLVSNYLLIFHTALINAFFFASLFALYRIYMMPNTNVVGYLVTILVLNIFNIYNILYNIKLNVCYNNNEYTKLFKVLLFVIQIVFPIYNIMLSILLFRNNVISKKLFLIYWSLYFIILFVLSYVTYNVIKFIAWF